MKHSHRRPEAAARSLALARRLLSAEPMLEADQKALQGAVRALQRSATTQVVQRPLLGKHLALLCRSPDCEPARLFESAATQLGALVSRVAPIDLRGGHRVQETARMLGTLYDAIECDHLSPVDAQRLQREAGVPVFNGLGRADHGVQRLFRAGEPLDPALAVQAVLLETVG